MENINYNTLLKSEKRFPIFLTKYDPLWQQDFFTQKQTLDDLLKNFDVYRISHIGSTAIKGIWARPVIDILIELNDMSKLDDIISTMQAKEYTLVANSNSPAQFYKTIESESIKIVYMIYIRKKGDNDELYFRDYLAEHDNIAWEYDKLRLKLWNKYPYNRFAYKNSKADFVAKYTHIAKQLYKDKYK